LKWTILRLCGCKIAALLQAFDLSVGSCGLANVLQCGMGFFLLFLREGEKNKINSIMFALPYQKAKSFLSLILSLSYLPAVSVFLHLLPTSKAM